MNLTLWKLGEVNPVLYEYLRALLKEHRNNDEPDGGIFGARGSRWAWEWIYYYRNRARGVPILPPNSRSRGWSEILRQRINEFLGGKVSQEMYRVFLKTLRREDPSLYRWVYRNFDLPDW